VYPYAGGEEVQIEGAMVRISARRGETSGDKDDLFGEPVNPDEQIIARRATMGEYLKYISKVEYLNGRMMTDSGVELFSGFDQFPEAIRAPL
jgi:hypothetical protein